MKYTSILIAVRDIEKSKQFYLEVLGLDIIADYGANVVLTGGLALQALDTWKGFTDKKDDKMALENKACELYFEDDDLDTFIAKLSGFKDIEYVSPLLKHFQGQKAVRFYDPDKHIVEVSESKITLIKRFVDGGLSAEETAKRMNVPVDYIESCLKQRTSF